MLREKIAPPANPVWSWIDAVIVIAALFVITPVAGAAKAAVRHEVLTFGLSGTAIQSVLLLIGTTIQAAVLVLGVLVLARRKGAGYKDLGLVLDESGPKILAGLAGGLLLATAVITIGFLLERIAGPIPPQDVEKVLRGFSKGSQIIPAFISLSILAPVSEELYFRGMAFPLFRSRFGPAAGIVLSALFFGAMHLDIYRLLPLSAGGLALAWFYEKTGSLLTSVVAHSTWNTVMLLLLYAGS